MSIQAGFKDRQALLEWLEYDVAEYIRLGYTGLCLKIESLDELDQEDCDPIIGALKAKIEEQK